MEKLVFVAAFLNISKRMGLVQLVSLAPEADLVRFRPDESLTPGARNASL
jgi:hypothetical protein